MPISRARADRLLAGGFVDSALGIFWPCPINTVISASSLGFADAGFAASSFKAALSAHTSVGLSLLHERDVLGVALARAALLLIQRICSCRVRRQALHLALERLVPDRAYSRIFNVILYFITPPANFNATCLFIAHAARDQRDVKSGSPYPDPFSLVRPTAAFPGPSVPEERAL
jgi:hypothetical protein